MSSSVFRSFGAILPWMAKVSDGDPSLFGDHEQTVGALTGHPHVARVALRPHARGRGERGKQQHGALASC
jgi:hypothetical protein